MVCIYCQSKTRVSNSRLQKRTNQVWRRRQCLNCHAIFTSLEHSAYDNTLAVQLGTSHIVPFQRDVFFLSIYEALRHRKSGASDASALTDTVLGKLLAGQANQGLIQRQTIVRTASDVLKRFDKAAHVQYMAFHPL